MQHNHTSSHLHRFPTHSQSLDRHRTHPSAGAQLPAAVSGRLHQPGRSAGCDIGVGTHPISAEPLAGGGGSGRLVCRWRTVRLSAVRPLAT